MADADGSYDLSAVGHMVRLLSSGADLVVGNRFRGRIEPHAMPWINRYVGSPLLSFLLNVFFGTHVGDAHCGLRAFSTRAYTEMALRTTGMEFASEMIVRAARLGLHIAGGSTTTRALGARNSAATATAGATCAFSSCTARRGCIWCPARSLAHSA